MLLTVIIIVILSLIFLLLLTKFSKLSLVEGIFAVTLVLIWPLTYKLILRYENDKNDITREINVVEKNIKILEASIDETTKETEELEEFLKDYDYDELEKKLEELNRNTSELDAVIKEKEELIKQDNEKYNNIINEINLLKQIKVIINDFPTFNQNPNYPNGCEIAALYTMLKFYKVNVTMEDLANNLIKGKAPYREDGIIKGGDPEIEFVGDPRLTGGKGYGVYQKPIITLANSYKKGMKDISGSSLDTVLKIVNRGKPVQVWATVDMVKPRACITWTTDDNKKVTWQCGFHSMVIIGYTHNTVIVSDPTRGDIRSYNKSTFEARYNAIGKRAIYYEK